MPKPLKVYSVNYDGRMGRAVTATSMTEAARLIGTSAHHMRNYGGENGCAELVAACMARPGVVLQYRLSDPVYKFTRVDGQPMAQAAPVQQSGPSDAQMREYARRYEWLRAHCGEFFACGMVDPWEAQYGSIGHPEDTASFDAAIRAAMQAKGATHD